MGLKPSLYDTYPILASIFKLIGKVIHPQLLRAIALPEDLPGH
jgi:hypothetical protein